MIIRSQDKKLLVNFKNVASLYANSKNKIVVMYPAVSEDSLWDELGQYSTEEKAIKVLDMIQNKYENVTYENNHGDQNCGEYASFQMPQDNEVTV